MAKLQISNSNLSANTLILNGFITFQETPESDFISFKVPTIGELADNPNTPIIQNLLFAEKETYEKMSLSFKHDTRGMFLYGLIITKNYYQDMLTSFFKKYIHDFKVMPSGLFVSEYKLTSNALEYISNVMLVSMGYKDIEELLGAEKPDPFEGMTEAQKAQKQKELAVEERLKKAKEKKQKQNKKLELTQEKIILAVSQVYSYTIEEIKKINYFTLMWYFSYVYKIDHHQVMQTAAGSGNLGKNSKYTHWLE